VARFIFSVAGGRPSNRTGSSRPLRRPHERQTAASDRAGVTRCDRALGCSRRGEKVTARNVRRAWYFRARQRVHQPNRHPQRRRLGGVDQVRDRLDGERLDRGSRGNDWTGLPLWPIRMPGAISPPRAKPCTNDSAWTAPGGRWFCRPAIRRWQRSWSGTEGQTSKGSTFRRLESPEVYLSHARWAEMAGRAADEWRDKQIAKVPRTASRKSPSPGLREVYRGQGRRLEVQVGRLRDAGQCGLGPLRCGLWRSPRDGFLPIPHSPTRCVTPSLGVVFG
jgi:hypothetical protein